MIENKFMYPVNFFNIKNRGVNFNDSKKPSNHEQLLIKIAEVFASTNSAPALAILSTMITYK